MEFFGVFYMRDCSRREREFSFRFEKMLRGGMEGFCIGFGGCGVFVLDLVGVGFFVGTWVRKVRGRRRGRERRGVFGLGEHCRLRAFCDC